VGARGDPLTQYQSQNPADGLLLSVLFIVHEASASIVSS
jgi:hypothetical protein